MEKTLQLILNKQKEFQKKFGFNENLSVEEKVKLIHTHSMFLVEETYEMLRELPYHKPWKNYSNLSNEKIEVMLETAREEWIDMLHFVANIAVFLGLDEEEIKRGYLEKNGLNYKRQEDPTLGYVTAI